NGGRKLSYSFFAKLYGYNIDGDPTYLSFFLLYATIVLLCAFVYKLGFAKKLPLLKSAIIYLFLLVGCFPLTIFGLLFPVVGCLIVITVVFGGYKLRLKVAKKQGEVES